MTQPWDQVVARYAALETDRKSDRSLEDLARRVRDSALGKGLFAWTSMHDLCIVQTEVDYPYDGPLLRLRPVSEREIEFRYVDTHIEARQWHRTVDADHAWGRFIEFLHQLRWFPAETLNSMNRP
jgi:hypothetical protein